MYRRNTRNNNPNYRELSSESEDDFHDPDSTFDKTLEEEHTIEKEIRDLKNRGFKDKLDKASDLFKNCKLDGSGIVYEDSEVEGEVEEEGFVAGGPEGQC